MFEGGGDKADMSKIKILHSADLHLDSPFQGLTAGKAAIPTSARAETALP